MIRSLDAVSARAVEVALELDLFANLDPAQDLDQLCRRLAVAPRGLAPLLYLLTSLGLVEEGPTGFSCSPETTAYLADSFPALRAAIARSPDWELLAQAVRTGRCVRHAIEGEDDGGQFFTQVVPILFSLHWPMARHLEGHLSPDISRVLDLGAGSAVWSLGLVSQRNEVRAVAVDRARVLEAVTRDYVQRHARLEQYELRPGSYYEVELEAGGYQVVYLGHLVHSDGELLSRALLARAYQALAPGGQVVVAEMVGSEPRALDYESNLFDLNMLMFTEAGRVFTARELEELVTAAGFRGCTWVAGPGQYPVLLARRGGL